VCCVFAASSSKKQGRQKESPKEAPTQGAALLAKLDTGYWILANTDTGLDLA
jgi:hypothetical protein